MPFGSIGDVGMSVLDLNNNGELMVMREDATLQLLLVKLILALLQQTSLLQVRVGHLECRI